MERIRSIRSGACRLCGGAGLLLAPLLLVSLLAAGSAHAGDPSRGADAYDAGDARVEAELLVDAGALRPGQTVRVGVLFRMDPGWHVYWRNAGDSGLPTRLDWNFEQAEVGPIR
jgi:thiol:disulfide interchange protein DsbD